MPKAKIQTSSGDIELCWESIGEGEPLLLIMGLGCQMVFWEDDFCQALASRGFRVIRFDNRDVGESTRFDHLGVPPIRSILIRGNLGLPFDVPYQLEDMAEDTVGLLDALDVPQAHIVGVSMGGMIAQLVAIRYPERVRSLTSMLSHPGDRLSKIPRPRALRALLQRMPRTRREAIESHVETFRTIGSPAPLFDEGAARRRAERQFDRGMSPRGFVRQMAAISVASDRRPALARVHVPSLVIHGSVDPLVRPRGGKQTARALPRARLVELDGMGHDIPRPFWPRVVDSIVDLRGKAASQTRAFSAS